MSLHIEETFELHAPVERTWRYLVDPRQVVNCLPGAELTEVQDAETYVGRVNVKVGPVTAAYDGRVTITGRDDAQHVVSMVGEGRECTGAGSAKMTITSQLTPLDGGATQVKVVADLDMLGRAEQFGRGVIESVNKQLFWQFTECLRGTLEAPDLAELRAEPLAPSPVATPRHARIAGAVPVIPAPSEPVRIVPVVTRAFVEWLRRVGVALIGRPRHP